MARTELFLLGPPRLERDGVPLQFDTRKILALAAYLAVSGLGAEGSRLSRDSLLALLWPELEPSRARAVLRRNLFVLKRALEGEWLLVGRQTAGLVIALALVLAQAVECAGGGLAGDEGYPAHRYQHDQHEGQHQFPEQARAQARHTF